MSVLPEERTEEAVLGYEALKKVEPSAFEVRVF